MLNRNKIDIIIGIVRGHGLGRRGVKVEGGQRCGQHGKKFIGSTS